MPPAHAGMVVDVVDVLVDIVLVDVDVDDVEVKVLDVEDVEVDVEDVDDVDVEVRCMLDDCDVTLVIMLPLYVWSCFGWQLLMFPLGQAVMFRYMVPVIVCPGEIFCGIVTLQIISLPGSTRVLVGRHAADRLP